MHFSVCPRVLLLKCQVKELEYSYVLQHVSGVPLLQRSMLQAGCLSRPEQLSASTSTGLDSVTTVIAKSWYLTWELRCYSWSSFTQ